MLREVGIVKSATQELLSLEHSIDLIDFLRKHLAVEYETVFRKEVEESIKLHKSAYHGLKDYDIRKYTLLVFKTTLSDRPKIDVHWHDSLDKMKVFMFYEHLLTHLPRGTPDADANNRLIDEQVAVYSLYKCLISKDPCEIGKHVDTLLRLNLTTLLPERLVEDDLLRHMVVDICFTDYLLPFLPKYVAMIP